MRYQLKTAYREDTTTGILEPLDFKVPLAALIPMPSQNLTRYHVVFALNRYHRTLVAPSK